MFATFFWSIITILGVLVVAVLFYFVFFVGTIGLFINNLRKKSDQFSQYAKRGRKVIHEVKSKTIQD